jgi:hypothetical protein
VIIIGVDKLYESAPPRKTKHGTFPVVDNCIEYKSFGYNPCDSGFVIGEFFEYEDVDIKLVSDIKDEKYIYPVCVRDFGHSLGIHIWEKIDNNTSFLDFISKKTLSHFRSGQAKLLIYYGYEEDSIDGDSLFRLHSDLLRKLSEKEIPIESVMYSDANILLHTESDIKDIKMVISNYCTNTFYRYTREHKQNLYHGKHEKSIENRQKWEDSRNRIRDKYFLCYNRIPKSHRALTVLSLYKNNNLDKGIVSFPNYGMSSWDIVEKKEDYLKKEHYWWILKEEDIIEEYEKYSDGLIEKLPLRLDKGFDICHSITHFNLNHYLNSYFVICTESHCVDRKESGNALAFTEKTLKPIMNFHPFILVANTGSLKHLKEYGFKTFSPFIDESYDDIDDAGERFLVIEQEINKLCSKPIEEIHEWYWSIEDILKHNYYHFYNKFAPKERQRFLDEISFKA